jgi:hypothetical protein
VARAYSRPNGANPTTPVTGETVSKLWHLGPKQRDATLREALARQLNHLRRDFPAIECVSRGNDKPSWTIDAVVPANQLAALASRRYVKNVMIDTIDGRRRSLAEQVWPGFASGALSPFRLKGRSKVLLISRTG